MLEQADSRACELLRKHCPNLNQVHVCARRVHLASKPEQRCGAHSSFARSHLAIAVVSLLRCDRRSCLEPGVKWHGGVRAESCDWCPELPGRLKVMHSHWLSRSRSAIVLRGTLYFDRGVHFLLAAPAAPGTGGLGRLQMLCHCVPASMRVRSLTLHHAACAVVLCYATSMSPDLQRWLFACNAAIVCACGCRSVCAKRPPGSCLQGQTINAVRRITRHSTTGPENVCVCVSGGTDEWRSAKARKRFSAPANEYICHVRCARKVWTSPASTARPWLLRGRHDTTMIGAGIQTNSTDIARVATSDVACIRRVRRQHRGTIYMTRGTPWKCCGPSASSSSYLSCPCWLVLKHPTSFT